MSQSEQSDSTPPIIRVDSHTHILPLPLAAKIRGFFENLFNDPSLAPPPRSCCSQLAPYPKKPTFSYSIDPTTLVRVLQDEHEGDEDQPAVWVLPYAHKAGMAQKLNATIKEMCEELGSDKLRLVIGATVHAADGEGGGLLPEQLLEEALAGGAKVAKLHCSVGDYDVMDPRLSNFFRLAEAVRLPVVIHGGTSIMGTTETEDLASIGPLCRAWPHLPVVLAHAGHPATETALLLAALHPNLHLDTTPVLSTPVLFPPNTPPQQLLSLALEGRILFGSDTPTVAMTRVELALDTRRWIRQAVARCVGALGVEDMYAEMEKLGEEAERMVFGEAALRLEDGVRPVADVIAELLQGTKARKPKL